ncbi:MAG: Na/Pi cotransporter family protein [Clostridia bacterium]|nr:Na/Pi cotransporter family protein [Clostridia bacterium]
MFATLVGGLAFFLYGMNAMSSGLEQMAGGKLETTLKKVTKSGFLSFFLGAGITIAIQSSSAMTVMLVGLVNSGIMNFADTFSMIMGSHVGTTLTAWLLTLSGISSGDNFFLVLLQPSTFAPILAFIGIVLRMVSKKEKRRNLGMILLGFAVLMAGMQMMSGSMSSLKDDPAFVGILTAFKSPIVALLAAIAFTAVIQSSAATVAIVQALALSAFATDSPITYQMAIPLIIGANIGTCMTSLISSIGTNKNAKRVVAMHVYTNAFGGMFYMILLYIAIMVSPDLLNAPISIFGVAVVHSLFNIANTLLFTPLKKPIIALCHKTVKSDKAEKHTVFLDERLFKNPPIAIMECRRLVDEMARISCDAVVAAIDTIKKYDEATIERVKEAEALTDKYEDKLSTYLVRISSKNISPDDSHAVARMLHGINDFERIGDHALNLCQRSIEIKEKKIVFSDDAREELDVITGALIEIINITKNSFISDDIGEAALVEPLEQVIDKLNYELKDRHVNRLKEGRCTVNLGFVYSDILADYERISDHCSNIAVYTLQRNSLNIDPHKFLNQVKSSDNAEFKEEYKMFEQKYAL